MKWAVATATDDKAEIKFRRNIFQILSRHEGQNILQLVRLRVTFIIHEIDKKK